MVELCYSTMSLSIDFRVFINLFLLGSFCFPLCCPCLLGTRFFLLGWLFASLYWFCFPSMKMGVICLNLVDSDSLISCSCSGMRSLSRLDISLAICAMVLLYAFWGSSMRARSCQFCISLLLLSIGLQELGFLYCLY